MKRFWRRGLAPGALFLAATLSASAGHAWELEVNGSLKTAVAILDASRTPSEEAGVYDLETVRARLDFRVKHGPWFIQLSPEARLAWTPPVSAAAGLFSFGGRRGDTLFNWETELFDENDVAGVLDLDRAFVFIAAGPAQISLGRQPIGFGQSRVYSPVDLVSPFAPAELDRETRPGNDAARLTLALGSRAEIGVLASPGKDFSGNTFLAHAEIQTGNLDFFALGGLARQRPVLGGTAVSEAAGIGLRLEGIILDIRRHGSDTVKPVISAGADYRFDGGLYLALEYLYNGPGADDRNDYPDIVGLEPFSLGLIPFHGRQYAFAVASKQIHPLIDAGVTLYANLTDTSILIWPRMTISPADGTEASIFVFVPLGGSETEFGPAPVCFGAVLSFAF